MTDNSDRINELRYPLVKHEVTSVESMPLTPEQLREVHVFIIKLLEKELDSLTEKK